ncbi:MAG: DUF4367 domain-containing protein [Clostridia bacterium]|nr:DUF4367 domain-containing protein [Clostridia bacterium]
MLKKGEGQKFFERIPKRVIGVAAAVLILLSTMTVFVKGDQLLTFVSNTFGTFIEIFFEEEDVQNAPAVIETVYAPTYIPEGYEFDYYEMNINGKISEFQWLGPEGYKICFTQYTFSGKHLIDIEDTAYVEFYHNDTRFLYWTKYGMVEYLWHTDEYLFTLIIQQHFSDEEHWKIINSIEEYKN